MTRKASAGLGKCLANSRDAKAAEFRAEGRYRKPVLDAGLRKSVLEQGNLEELVATIELRKEEWADAVGTAEIVEGPTLICLQPEMLQAEMEAGQRRNEMSIPRRPRWVQGMTTEEFAKLESEALRDWRRELSHLTAERGLLLTCYEKNLELWRQLWCCVERSDLLVEIVDARDPEFYRCRDFPRFLRELDISKSLVLVINKADFITAAQRDEWGQYFRRIGVVAVFFSALRCVQLRAQAVSASAELPLIAGSGAFPLAEEGDEGSGHRSDMVPLLDARTEEPLATSADCSFPAAPDVTGEGDTKASDNDILDPDSLLEVLCSRLHRRDGSAKATVGFVGYPNVGKSTLINALIGAKKVGMSCRPGKTKHLQTLDIPHLGVTLCDCPGLVFPSVAATRAHLVISNTVPLDDLHECLPPIRLILLKIGAERVLDKYGCARSLKDARDRVGNPDIDEAQALLAALATSRGHFLKVGVPDQDWAARRLLRDFVSGELLYCEPPPRPAQDGDAEVAVKSPAPVSGSLVDVLADETEQFADLDAFFNGADVRKPRRTTKRRERFERKRVTHGACAG